ncbi:MAG: hypothetical protein JW891_08075 [Candidatus Lokiarchaeota archaeon]|nr:hypothetical protein [Candidatus Lokiarchaeota archaeon]
MIGNSTEKKKDAKSDNPNMSLPEGKDLVKECSESSIQRIKKNLVKKLNIELSENLSIIAQINDLLLTSNLMPEEKKLEYCKGQRHFMKQYLKYISLKYGL